ncbi:hypothetical protein EVAR_54052_1 [Eumeta japonica]|uniref:Uncharacterized protein n=1 Tax=Eumeta variegata TaxID=151549 RepID=A0A4C1XIF9_EUMVA|nr:hypothetical protein EVAR_54052_1 [Eumeta japonica]
MMLLKQELGPCSHALYAPSLQRFFFTSSAASRKTFSKCRVTSRQRTPPVPFALTGISYAFVSFRTWEFAPTEARLKLTYEVGMCM